MQPYLTNIQNVRKEETDEIVGINALYSIPSSGGQVNRKTILGSAQNIILGFETHFEIHASLNKYVP